MTLDLFKALISNTKDQYKQTFGTNLTNADTLVNYATTHGDSLLNWDTLFDDDETVGNHISDERYLADGKNLFFQSKSDSDKLTNKISIFDITTETMTDTDDKIEIFKLLGKDGTITDSLGHTLSESDFETDNKYKIKLTNDGFNIIGFDYKEPLQASCFKPTNIKKVNDKTSLGNIISKSGKTTFEAYIVDKDSKDVALDDVKRLTQQQIIDKINDGSYKIALVALDKDGKPTGKASVLTKDKAVQKGVIPANLTTSSSSTSSTTGKTDITEVKTALTNYANAKTDDEKNTTRASLLQIFFKFITQQLLGL